MRKLIKNPSSTETVTIKSLILTPGAVFEISTGNRDFCHSETLLDYVKNGTLQIGWWENSFYTDPLEGELWLLSMFDDPQYIIESSSVNEYTQAIVTDTPTSKKAISSVMNSLTVAKELYNDPNNPIYDASFQKFIGTGGREVEHLGRTANLENIHGKTGWHQREIYTHGIKRPFDLLIYYGYPNSFNSATNAWTNELVAQDMAKYELIVLGNGVAAPSHPDYANTQVIIPRVKLLNANCKVFGYASLNQTLANFQTMVTQWDNLHVDGILIDEAGYDYGTVATNGRVAFNEKVTYVHGKTYAKLCFVNAWNMDHIIGTTNDVSYPNTTYNSGLVASTLNSYDWYLLESFPVNTTAYSGNAGYEAKADWATRGSLAIAHRYTYGINLASVSVIANANINGQKLFDFSYMSSLLWSLDAVGSSDDSYASGSATVTYWSRTDVMRLGRIWSASPSVMVDVGNANIYWRYFDFGKIKLDHTASAQLGTIIYDDTDTSITWYVKRISGCWSPIGNSTTVPLADGIAAPSVTGTATARNVATTTVNGNLVVTRANADNAGFSSTTVTLT